MKEHVITLLQQLRDGHHPLLTWDQWRAMRLNSAERRELIRFLDDDALARGSEYVLANCKRPVHMETYDYALQNRYVPEMIRRLKTRNNT